MNSLYLKLVDDNNPIWVGMKHFGIVLFVAYGLFSVSIWFLMEFSEGMYTHIYYSTAIFILAQIIASGIYRKKLAQTTSRAVVVATSSLSGLIFMLVWYVGEWGFSIPVIEILLLFPILLAYVLAMYITLRFLPR